MKYGVHIFALGVNWCDKACYFNGELNVDLKTW